MMRIGMIHLMRMKTMIFRWPKKSARDRKIPDTFLFPLRVKLYSDSKTAIEKVGVRLKFIWWRRRESNPCPKATWKEFLRVQFVIYVPFSQREQTLSGNQELQDAWYGQSLPYARSPLKAHPRPARGPSGEDGRLIRQPLQQYCCQLNLKNYPFYRGQVPRPAYPASRPPSKPVRPHI